MKKTADIKFYAAWYNTIRRCTNLLNKDYANYGQRGIIVCTAWLDFINFKSDMYESYLSHVQESGKKQTSIDRINVNGNYEPSNCRWATWQQQRLNQRPIILKSQKQFKAISPNGEEFISNNQTQQNNK